MKASLILLTVVLASCACPVGEQEMTSPGVEVGGKDPPGLVDVSADLRELRAAFNSASGKVRLVLIVSPG